MSNSISHIIKVYKSRENLLEILESRGFDISNYQNLSVNEIGVLIEQNQLDMLLTNNETNKKIYVKYYVTKNIKPPNIYSIVEDLFHLENILSKNDDLIIIVKDEPNDTLVQTIKDIWMEENIYISLLNIQRVQFNILKHKLVPKHNVLSKENGDIIRKKFNIMNDNQLPDISYFSPVSLVMGFRPGDIIEIERNSRTSISSNFYRICKI